ncbi:phenylacetate--CoA ligase family protein [Natrialbaceae archaeon A-CW1-1]
MTTTPYDLYGDRTLAQLRNQLERLADVPLYEDTFAKTDLEPTDVTSWEDFRRLPLTSTDDLLDDVDANPPTGSLHEKGAMISFTPAKDRELPVFETPEDIERYAEVHGPIFDRLGIKPGMRAMVAFGYHGFGTGYLLHRALEYNGVEVIPAGPGDSEAKAARIDEFDVDVLWANPSFALEIAEHGGDSLDIFIGGGEPFTSVEGRREQVHKAFGDLDCAVDCFGLRQAWPVAVECAAEVGLHVADEYMLVEIIDPETTEVLPLGERGELVLTHLDREAGGLLRYRTGDLSVLEEGSSPHVDGSTLVMPKGVFGRTDEMHKIKGVKVYPQGIPLVLGSFDGLNPFAYRLTISNEGGSDHLAVTVEGEADTEALTDALTDRLLVRPDEISIVDDLEDGSNVVDERY